MRGKEFYCMCLHFRTVLGVASVILNPSLVESLTWMFGVVELALRKCLNSTLHANHIKATYSRGLILQHKSMEPLG